MNKTDLTRRIKEEALALGYESCGVIPADALKEYSGQLDERVGRFPSSRPLYEKLYDLAAPEKKAPWARSVVVCVRRYDTYKIPPGADRYFGKTYLFDGRVTYSDEYRNAARFEARLAELGMKSLKDSVAARLSAVKAGLGEFGKNNFLYTPRHGSWVFVNTWTVDAQLEYDEPAAGNGPGCPPGCRKCIDACPTRALSGPFVMDRGRCVAQLSFFSTQLPPEPVRGQMGEWLYGCDVCQNVCPRNRNAWNGDREFPGLESIAPLLAPEKIAELDGETFLKTLQPRFWYIGPEGFWLWKCNALRAMANSGEKQHHPLLKRAREGRDEKVRAMAAWACEKAGV